MEREYQPISALSGTPDAGAPQENGTRIGRGEGVADVALRVLGRARLALDDPTGLSSRHLDHVHQRLYALSLSIAAGTAQVQRNIVGERLLGLPKER